MTDLAINYSEFDHRCAINIPITHHTTLFLVVCARHSRNRVEIPRLRHISKAIHNEVSKMKTNNLLMTRTYETATNQKKEV